MTETIGLPQLEPIPGTTLVRLTQTYRIYVSVLKGCLIIPKDFICDTESTPWKGENSIAGIVHDYCSRKGVLDSKWKAAMVYYEVQSREDAMRDAIKERPWYSVAWDCGWRHIKAMFVAVCPDFVYWHKLPVNATVADMI